MRTKIFLTTLLLSLTITVSAFGIPSEEPATQPNQIEDPVGELLEQESPLISDMSLWAFCKVGVEGEKFHKDFVEVMDILSSGELARYVPHFVNPTVLCIDTRLGDGPPYLGEFLRIDGAFETPDGCKEIVRFRLKGQEFHSWRQCSGEDA